jgi:hypothetical protein
MPEPSAPAFSFLAIKQRRALDLLDLECSLSSCHDLSQKEPEAIENKKSWPPQCVNCPFFHDGKRIERRRHVNLRVLESLTLERNG